MAFLRTLHWIIASPERDTLELAAMNAQLRRDEGQDDSLSHDDLRRRMHGFLSGEYRAALFAERPDERRIGYALWAERRDHPFLRQFFGGGLSPAGFGRRMLDRLKNDI